MVGRQVVSCEWMVDCLRRLFWGAGQNETDGQDARATILPGTLPGGEKDHGRRTGRSALPFAGSEQTGRAMLGAPVGR